MAHPIRAAWGLVLAASVTFSASAQPATKVLSSGGPPQFRLVPPPGTGNNPQPFRDLFEHPEQWETARGMIDSIGYYDHRINQFSDEELTLWFAIIQDWGKKFFIETGALSEWCTTGRACFESSQPTYERFLRLGAQIDAFSLDEPFHKGRHYQLGTDLEIVNEVADWIRIVRETYPGVAIGSIEPYPSISIGDLKWWIAALNLKLTQLGVDGIDFFCLDADWRRFTQDGNWNEVLELENFCKSRGLPFSLIYWAAEGSQETLDLVWRYQVLFQGHQYRRVGGAPDEYDLQSWLAIPSMSVPETGEHTLTRSVIEFYNNIIAAPPITPTPTITPSPTKSFIPTFTPTITRIPTATRTPSLTSTATPTETYHPADVNFDRSVDRWDLLLLVRDWASDAPDQGSQSSPDGSN